MTGNYYAVIVGRIPGIYTDWSVAESMVKGYPGAIFKSFRNRIDAEMFMKRTMAVNTSVDQPTVSSHILPLLNKTIVYIDGSFVDNVCGFGLIIITSSNEKITAYGKVPPIPSSPQSVHYLEPNSNLAYIYAVYVALSLVRGDILLYTSSKYIIDCFTFYVHDWMQNGWRGVANRSIIEGTFSLMMDRSVIFSPILTHNGKILHEEASELANKGRLSTESLIITRNSLTT